MKIKINITLDEEVIEYLNKYCEENHINRSSSINKIIHDYMKVSNYNTFQYLLKKGE